jgi:amidase
MTKAASSLLHGIPILLKDNIVTLDAMEATCGSYALIGAKPAKESAAVTILRNAGAIILGKANLAEWAGFRSTSGCSGWSARGRQSQGIYHPGQKPSGSSSGSAISTALGLCFASIGSEVSLEILHLPNPRDIRLRKEKQTGFSVVSPAEKSGVIGFKPTRGLIPSDGIIFSSQELDTLGLLTRTVQDADSILHEIRAWSTPSVFVPQRNSRTRPLSLGSYYGTSLTGLRIGVPYRFLGEADKLGELKSNEFAQVVCRLEKAGAEVIQGIDVQGADIYEGLPNASKEIVLLTHIKIAMDDYLSGLGQNPNNLRSLQDIIDFTKECEEEEYPQRNIEFLECAQATDPDDPLYKAMLRMDEYFAREGIAGTLDRHKVDVLMMPTLSATMQSFAAKAGSPVISVPMGAYPDGTEVDIDRSNGLVTVASNIPYVDPSHTPHQVTNRGDRFSVYIYGRPKADMNVLRVAYAIEKLKETSKALKPYRVPQRDLADFVSQRRS